MRPLLPVASLLLLSASVSVFPQEAVFRSDVNLVRILATVKSATGELVSSLEKDDFVIDDNGARQQIAVFDRTTAQPLSVAVLVDNSGSTAKELKYEIESVGRFLRALFAAGNPKDAVALYSFNYEVVRRNYFTRNQAPLNHSLRQLKAEAGTSLYDAICLAAEDLQTREGRRVAVIVTDGGDTTSVKNFHTALEAAQLADAVIYPILVLPITNEAGRNVGGEHALASLAAGTGGHVFAPEVGAALDAAFAEIIKELRTQYLLAYYPKGVPLNKNRFHKLDVRVLRPDLRVFARNGYYGEAEPSGSAASRISVLPQTSGQEK